MTTYGGAEIVLQALADAFPAAPIYTTVYDQHTATWVAPERVRTVIRGPLARLLRRRELLDPFLPILLEHIDLSEYDTVISVTSSYAKGVLTKPSQFHFCYLLNTTRYLYEAQSSLMAGHALLRLPGMKQLSYFMLGYLRRWDLLASRRPDRIVTLSALVAQRMLAVYGRASDAVLAPPLPPLRAALTLKSLNKPPTPYYVCVSRLVEYKNISLALQAAKQVGHTLVVAGTGREEWSLRRTAGTDLYIRTPDQTIQACLSAAHAQQKKCIFWGECTEQEKGELYSHAIAAVVPGIEDFGISIIEPLQYGIPVLCSKQSGAAEHLVDSVHGTFFDEQTVESLSEAWKKQTTRSFNPITLQDKAKEFTHKAFVRKLHNIFSHFYKKHVTIGG